VPCFRCGDAVATLLNFTAEVTLTADSHSSEQAITTAAGKYSRLQTYSRQFAVGDIFITLQINNDVPFCHKCSVKIKVMLGAFVMVFSS